MKLALPIGVFVVLIFVLTACAGRGYRPESVAEKMQRYEAQESRVVFQNWEIDGSYFKQRAPDSVTGPHKKKSKSKSKNKSKTVKLKRLGKLKVKPGVLPARPLGQIYFLSLLEQYYQLGQFLPEPTAPLKICANFHDVLVTENIYPWPKKQKLQIPAAAILAQKSYLFPLGQLPLSEEFDASTPTVRQSSDAALAQAAEDALRWQQQRIYQELWPLCDGENAPSINRDNFLNLVRFKDEHPLDPSAAHLKVLLKVFPLSNLALLDSLSATPASSIYTDQIIEALDAEWFKDYLQDQRRQRQQLRRPASESY